MTARQIVNLRASLGLTQEQFAELLGVHSLTISKWERGLLTPTPYQATLMQSFTTAKQKRPSVGGAPLVAVLVGAGVAAALLFLLKVALDDDDPEPRPPRKSK